MQPRKLVLILAVALIASGLFLYAGTMSQTTNRSTATARSSWANFSNSFQYGSAILTPDNPPTVIVGTTGTATLILLKTPFRGFSNYVCEQGHYEPSPDQCNYFGGGEGFNDTILQSYLEAYHPDIVLSRTIANQNVTLNYPVTTRTEFTLVLAQLGPGVTRTYWETTWTNQTLTYPLLGYSERPGQLVSLPNISAGLLIGGVGGLIVALTLLRPAPPIERRKHGGPATNKCPQCSQENLFFSTKCSCCGIALKDDTPRVIAAH